GLILLALLLQLGDISKAFVYTRASIDNRPAWQTTMTSPIWHQIAHRFSHVVFLQPPTLPLGLITFSKIYQHVAYYAATNHITVNIAYMARMNKKRIATARQQHIRNLMQGNAAAGTLYIIDDKKLWAKLKCTHQRALWYDQADGLNLVASRNTIPALGSRGT